IEFNRNYLFFTLDYFYGFLDERETSFEEEISEQFPAIYENLFSNNEMVYSQAVADVMNHIIGDGHTNAFDATSAFGGGSTLVANNKSERTTKLSDHANNCFTLRYMAGTPINTVRYSGTTAIISFDSFSHSQKELTQDNVATLSFENKDTFALLIHSMNEIEKHGGVENVIFDITCNGGGDSNALVTMVGIMNREFDNVMYVPIDGSYSTVHYQIDTNLDGLFDENDGYAGKYNFHILTSNYSFSCANLFPCLAKDNNIATIIGKQSGGGACTVGYSCTVDGKPFRMSSLIRQGGLDKAKSHYDAGVPVDYEIEPEHFYDDAYLDEFVNSIH
nr:hypothetical protein [Bacilli bacterium]